MRVFLQALWFPSYLSEHESFSCFDSFSLDISVGCFLAIQKQPYIYRLKNKKKNQE